MSFLKKTNCLTFAIAFYRSRPSASLNVALSFTQLHFFVLDYEQGKYYTVEWKLYRRHIPFLWLIAPFCDGRPVVRCGFPYRHFRGLVIQLLRSKYGTR